MYDFKAVEERTRAKWKEHEKKLAKALQDDAKKKVFSFLEGPPTANAPPALHHLEVRTMKDVVNKFWFMKGFSVPRKGGWDTHGLPVEVQVEKKLGLNSKKDILTYGEDKFIRECRESIFSNITDWEESTKELGYWIDLEHPYRTLDNEYIESVWWSLGVLHEKGLLYEGYKVVPFCPRCQTPLSSHEVSQGYKDVEDTSVYVAFRLQEGGYILAWTTTPWTLPGNVALAVGKKILYVQVRLADGDLLILGKDKLNLLEGKYSIVKEFSGKDLVGKAYEPLFAIDALQNEKSNKIIAADFVSVEEGTGVVHTAGMYGEDDYEVCKKEGLPLVHTVGEDGKFNSLVPQWEGKFVKDKKVEAEILENLKQRKLLFKVEKITHSYPFCWRCSTPLLYYAINSWFIAVTKVKDRLIALNKKINWHPSHIKEGRFGVWLGNIKDWSLSRFKSWGTPLPIWRCVCGEEKIIGSVAQLRKYSDKPFSKVGKPSKNITDDYDLHKPWIDKVTFDCACGKKMERLSDLIDVWYDSGAAPFAQFHYPFENKKMFQRRFPYDFIAEGIDQTRGWFYTLHAIAVMVFDDIAYKNVICAGHIVDENAEKMSKSKGNVIKPREILDVVGVDATRLQFLMSDVGNQKRFSAGMVRESVLPFLNMLYNSHTFYSQTEKSSGKKKEYVEDRWIMSRLHNTIKLVSESFNNYALDKALEALMHFVVHDLSRGYIKLTRDRDDTREILGEILESTSLLLAPFAPYLSEEIYSSFSKESVHLSSWPSYDKKKINEQLEQDFMVALAIIEHGLRERDLKKVGLRWPILSATIFLDKKLSSELTTIIQTQLNVKEVIVKKGSELTVTLDMTLTPQLEAEGYARELSRKVQAARKNAGLVKQDKIILNIISDDLQDFFTNQKSFIKERTNSKEIFVGSSKKFSNNFVESIKDKKIEFSFQKV